MFWQRFAKMARRCCWSNRMSIWRRQLPIEVTSWKPVASFVAASPVNSSTILKSSRLSRILEQHRTLLRASRKSFRLAYSTAGKATQLLSFYLNFVSDKATEDSGFDVICAFSGNKMRDYRLGLEETPHVCLQHAICICHALVLTEVLQP